MILWRSTAVAAIFCLLSAAFAFGIALHLLPIGSLVLGDIGFTACLGGLVVAAIWLLVAANRRSQRADHSKIPGGSDDATSLFRCQYLIVEQEPRARTSMAIPQLRPRRDPKKGWQQE